MSGKNQYYYLNDPVKDGLASLTLGEGEIPQPKRGQVLIRVRACSLNYRDRIVATGKITSSLKHLVPLSDGAGEIVEVGEDVTAFKKGDRVYGTFFQSWMGGEMKAEDFNTALGGNLHGMLSQYKVLDQNGIVKIPENLTFEEAATLPCAAITAWNCLFEGPKSLKLGETVLVLGTGGVSIFALQFAKAAGARVILTTSSDDKAAIAKKLGADDIVNYTKNPEWDAEVLKLTGGRGVDHVMEVGGAGTLPRSCNAVRVYGHVGLVGVLVSSDQSPAMTIMRKSINVRGIYVASREMYENMNRAITQTKLKPVVDKVFPFAQAKEAFELLVSQNFVGKIVVRVD